MKSVRSLAIILLVIIFYPDYVFCEPVAKQSLEARYTFDFYRSDKFSEKIKAIDYLFEIGRYDTLKKGLGQIADGRIRSVIIKKLGQLKNLEYLDLFVRYLDFELTPFWQTRVAAVEALENYQEDFVVPYFLEATQNDPHWEVKARSAVAIARLGKEEDMNKVISMLVDPGNEEGEYQIVLALGSMDTPLSSVALFDKWHSRQQRVVAAISYIMGIRNYQDAFESIVENLESPEPEKRKAAFFAVALFPQNDPMVTAIIRKALFDPEQEIRLLSIFYLTWKKDHESILTLQRIAEEMKEPARIRQTAILALRQLGLIGQIVSIKGNQLITSVGLNFGLKKNMRGQVIRKEPFLEAGSWPITTLNSTNSALEGPEEVLKAINEDRDNYQIIFLFPAHDYLYEIYNKLNLPLWVREQTRKKKYVFTY